MTTQYSKVWFISASALLVSLALAAFPAAARPADDPWRVDFRQAPVNWQTAICLPDDAQKSLVGKQGDLLYDYAGGNKFNIRISLDLAGKPDDCRQELVSPRVPIVRTIKRYGPIEVAQEAFAVGTPDRRDVLLARFVNRGTAPASVQSTLAIFSRLPLQYDKSSGQIRIGSKVVLTGGRPIEQVEPAEKGTWSVRLGSFRTVAPREEVRLAVVIGLDGHSPPVVSFNEARELRAAAETFWQKADLPYGHIQVPDAGIQALLDSSIRNIYQAREIRTSEAVRSGSPVVRSKLEMAGGPQRQLKVALPAFQVGPTCYRGLWMVDGSFILEAVSYLGRAAEARNGIRYLLGFQRKDGQFLLMDGHWKETGIMLWAAGRHAQLTDDPAWLLSIWPRIEDGFRAIQHLRATGAAADPAAPNYRLIPDGFSDGGLGGKYAEYTNVYWNLAGMRAAVDAAEWLSRRAKAGLPSAASLPKPPSEDEIEAWRREYADFLATFRRAAARDMQTDAHGNRFLPIRMRDDQHVAPQKGQWGFLHAVFPGKVFAPDDPLVCGNMAMLHAAEREGMEYGTGWLSEGIWNYFASFYAHAWLWAGDGDKAARLLYAFANHASPLLAWREEQSLVGQEEKICGDMPHNWASAEFIRLVRHLLALERGDELHLLEGLPAAWTRPGAVVALRDVLTEFGPLSLELRVAASGDTARLSIVPPRRNPPRRIVLHLGPWAEEGLARKSIELPAAGPIEQTLRLKRP